MNGGTLYLEIAVWSQALSSVIFIAVLVFMWYRWILPVLLDAQARSHRQIAEAERHRDEVKGALVALQEEIENARHDAGLIAQRAELHAAREREALIAETTQAGERSLRDAGGELERALTAARSRLRDELVKRALQIARGDAVARVGAPVDARLIEGFVGSLEHGPRG
jgi:F0F1-type ATP synthase membrane subunit b/b'